MKDNFRSVTTTNYTVHIMVFLGKIFRGGKPMFREIEGGRRLELKYIKLILMYFASAYENCIEIP